MRSPWGPQWDPLGFPHVIPIDGFHVMHMWCQFASRLVSPFRGFSAGNVFLIASLVASAPGQCGGAQPGMPCLGKHIVSNPPGMVFALHHFPYERRCCVHTIAIRFPVDCTYISTLGTLGAHLMPIGFHVGSPLATRWAPWISNWGPLLCPWGPHAIPIWVPIGLRLAPHGIPIWGAPIVCPCDSHGVPRGIPLDSHVVP